MSFFRRRAGDAESLAIVALFTAVAVIKLGLLAALGPLYLPDTAGYIEYAEHILRSPAWLHDAGLSSSAAPVLAFRVVGYPALIAGAMTVGGPDWPYPLIALQSVLSFAAAWALYRLARQLGLSWPLAIAVVAAFMLSFQLALDQSLLTDSLNASFIVIAICLLASGAVAQRPLRFREAALVGLALAAAFLLREAMQFLVILLLPLVAVRLWLAGRGRWLHAAVAAALVVLPLAATIQLYEAWNQYRTGERFVTTISALSFTQAISEAARRDGAVIAGDTPLDRAAREQLKAYTYDEVIAINDVLFHEGFKATDISRMASVHYLSSWREYPLAMLAVLRRHVSERAAKLTIRPFGAICETIEWAHGEHRCSDYRDLYRSAPSFAGLPWTAPVFFVLLTIETALAVSLFCGFLIGAPCLVVSRLLSSRGRIDPAPLTIASFWLLYIGWFIAYGIVHYEDRYMLPVIPFSILGGFYAYREGLLRGRVRMKAAVATP